MATVSKENSDFTRLSSQENWETASLGLGLVTPSTIFSASNLIRVSPLRTSIGVTRTFSGRSGGMKPSLVRSFRS